MIDLDETLLPFPAPKLNPGMFSSRIWTPSEEGDLVRIPLSRGMHATIDAVDLPLVDGYSWCAVPEGTDGNTWYATSRSNERPRKTIRMHRIICGTPGRVDHRDGNGLNNRRSNLRPATSSQNKANSRVYRTNRVGLKGVQVCRNRWRARIRFHGALMHLGVFPSPEEAALAYDRSAVRLFGEFALCNFPVPVGQ